MVFSNIAGSVNGWILMLKKRILWLRYVYMYRIKVLSFIKNCNGVLELYDLLDQTDEFGI